MRNRTVLRVLTRRRAWCDRAAREGRRARVVKTTWTSGRICSVPTALRRGHGQRRAQHVVPRTARRMTHGRQTREAGFEYCLCSGPSTCELMFYRLGDFGRPRCGCAAEPSSDRNGAADHSHPRTFRDGCAADREHLLRPPPEIDVDSGSRRTSVRPSAPTRPNFQHSSHHPTAPKQ